MLSRAKFGWTRFKLNQKQRERNGTELNVLLVSSLRRVKLNARSDEKVAGTRLASLTNSQTQIETSFLLNSQANLKASSSKFSRFKWKRKRTRGEKKVFICQIVSSADESSFRLSLWIGDIRSQFGVGHSNRIIIYLTVDKIEWPSEIKLLSAFAPASSSDASLSLSFRANFNFSIVNSVFVEVF